jgi:hypothetical protein
VPPIDDEQRSTDRGRHLVDLVAEGLGRGPAAGRPAQVDDAYLRRAYTLGGVSLALLLAAVVALIAG